MVDVLDRRRSAKRGAEVPAESRRRVAAALPDHIVERAIVLLSGSGLFTDSIWLPVLIEESRRRGLPITVVH
jgi:hypothetical protein